MSKKEDFLVNFMILELAKIKKNNKKEGLKSFVKKLKNNNKNYFSKITTAKFC